MPLPTPTEGCSVGRIGPRSSVFALLVVSAAGLIALAGHAAGELEAASSTALRGVVLITVDTLRADHVGAYGGPVPTPGMDRLAAEGALIERAFTPMPTTGPAHASLFTGLHPWNHGVLDNAVPLPEAATSIAELASAAGVHTSAFVSSFILDARFRLSQGFEAYSFEASESYFWRGKHRPGFWSRADTTTRAAMSWLTTDAVKDPRPFFLFVHYFDPHTPYAPPPQFRVSADHPVALPEGELPEGIRDAEQLRSLIRAYRGEVRFVDSEIARLLTRLELLGILDRVAIVLASDHGEGLGEHGLLQHGANLHDELVRVPLLVRAPGVPPGRLPGPAQLEDLAPTVLSFLGVPVPEGLDGRDLGPYLRRDVAASPRTAAVGRRKRAKGDPVQFYQHRYPDKWIGARHEAGERYDLRRDPRERDPQVAAGAPDSLVEEIARQRIGERSAAPAEPDAETQRALKALGYLD